MAIRSRNKNNALKMALQDVVGIIQTKANDQIIQELLEKSDPSGELSMRNIEPIWLQDLVDTLDWLYDQGVLHTRESTN